MQIKLRHRDGNWHRFFCLIPRYSKMQHTWYWLTFMERRFSNSICYGWDYKFPNNNGRYEN